MVLHSMAMKANTSPIRRELEQILPYSSGGKLPRMSTEAQSFVATAHDYLATCKPRGVSHVVTLPLRGVSTADAILYAFGSFRSEFAAIERLAKALAPLYLQTLVLPIVKPISDRELKAAFAAHTPFLRTLGQHGILCFAPHL